jgi:hypothetical protein
VPHEEEPVDANTVIAICATIIALGSLWVSYTQIQIARSHNRQTVRPLLKLRRIKNYGSNETGVQIINAGLGPAIITSSTVSLDNVVIGPWNLHTYHEIVANLPMKPHISSAFSGITFLAGQTSLLLHLDNFTEDEYGWFWELITQRLQIEIRYESLYGGENYRVELPPLT